MSNGTTIANQIGARLSLRKPQSESLTILCSLLEQLKLDKEPDLHEETLRQRILDTAIDVYKRKEEVIRIIEEQGKLTPKLKADIERADKMQRVEDL